MRTKIRNSEKVQKSLEEIYFIIPQLVHNKIGFDRDNTVNTTTLSSESVAGNAEI